MHIGMAEASAGINHLVDNTLKKAFSTSEKAFLMQLI
jgi:hypothetical protein